MQVHIDADFKIKLPEEVVRRLGLEPNSMVELSVQDGKLIMEPIRSVGTVSITLTLHLTLERRLQEIAQREGTSKEVLVQQFILERTHQEEVRLGILPDSSAR